jgi:hypothetical protein
MQPIEYRRLGDPMIIRISVTLGLLFYVGTERFGNSWPKATVRSAMVVMREPAFQSLPHMSLV